MAKTQCTSTKPTTTSDRLDRLLALIDNWITDVRAHAAEPETTTAEA